MYDQRYDGDHKQEMNQAACNVERQPRHDPNNKEEYCQNQKDEISHAILRSTDGVRIWRKRVGNNLAAVVVTA
jgi:hypothetical protein